MLTDQLRLETRAQHDRMEQLNELPTTQADYVAQLVTFYGFVAPWEKAVARVLPESDPIRAGREKTAWLEEDLEFFGYDAARRAALPRATELPSTESRAHILGAAYVLEGSTLGGQFISQHLVRTFGFEGGRGYRYFASYGPAVRKQWEGFRAELLEASTPENDAIIVVAARQTFERMHAWFSTQKVVPA